MNNGESNYNEAAKLLDVLTLIPELRLCAYLQEPRVQILIENQLAYVDNRGHLAASQLGFELVATYRNAKAKRSQK